MLRRVIPQITHHRANAATQRLHLIDVLCPVHVIHNGEVFQHTSLAEVSMRVLTRNLRNNSHVSKRCQRADPVSAKQVESGGGEREHHRGIRLTVFKAQVRNKATDASAADDSTADR